MSSVTVNGKLIDVSMHGGAKVSYRWFVRAAGLQPMVMPFPKVRYTLPDGKTGEVLPGHKGPTDHGAIYIVTGG